jgi:L-ascorbate metabolism protein UlaG (beta-lactamase superfamily)
VYNLVFLLPQFGKTPDYKKDSRILKSKQFLSGSFHNDGMVEMKMGISKFGKMMKAFFSSSPNKRPPNDCLISDKSLIKFEKATGDNTQITWFGHSTMMIDIDGKRLLLDPILSDHASPFSFAVSRFKNALRLDDSDLKKLGEIDAVIISHDHFDHLDYQTIKKLDSQIKHYFVPLGVGEHLRKWGVDNFRISELDWWEETEYFGLKLACTPGQHFSGRDPRRRNSSLWCSWVIFGKESRIFFSGDSGYFGGFSKIGEKYGPFHLAMMECGQYNELWHEIHMMPEESVQASLDVKAVKMLPIHNSAFSLSIHSWDEPQKRAYIEAGKVDVDIVKVKAGQSFILSN